MTQNINSKLLEPKSEFIMLSDCLKEGNLIWDQDTTSPYNVNTNSHQQVMRIKKISIRGLLVDPISKSPNRRIVRQTAGRITNRVRQKSYSDFPWWWISTQSTTSKLCESHQQPFQRPGQSDYMMNSEWWAK